MLTFRDAAASDAGLISHIYASSWRSAYRGLIADHYLDRLPDEYWVPSIRSWLGSGQLYGLLVCENGRPVGCAIYGRARDADYASWGEIVSLYLLPEATGRGIGSALPRETLSLLKQDGYIQCYLWAIEGNLVAEVFYLRHGFIKTDDRVTYRICGQDVTDLRFVLADE